MAFPSKSPLFFKLTVLEIFAWLCYFVALASGIALMNVRGVPALSVKFK